MKLSILFYPNPQKAVIKTGKVPMYLRVVLNRKKAEMRLNIELTTDELKKWDDKTMRFTDREMSDQPPVSRRNLVFDQRRKIWNLVMGYIRNDFSQFS